MCDGMGWFSRTDYKRALLVYNRIYYLIPATPVEFEDVSGLKQSMFYPVAFRQNASYTVHHFQPDQSYAPLISASAQLDAADPAFASLVATIPANERLYTWRAVNGDGDYKSGESLGLLPGQDVLAHAMLLNKFLLAADQLNCIPVTGKPYIHFLISQKYRTAVDGLRTSGRHLLPDTLRAAEGGRSSTMSRIMSVLIPDDELERRTEEEILAFKERHQEAFNRFSYWVWKLVDQVHALPIDPEYESDVKKLLDTDVWKEKEEAENELRSAWGTFFKSAIKGAVGGLISLGITPFLSLGALPLATVAAAAAAISPWAVSEMIALADARKKAQRHGIYYLMSFAG
jgi:hypothetical protein